MVSELRRHLLPNGNRSEQGITPDTSVGLTSEPRTGPSLTFAWALPLVLAMLVNVDKVSLAKIEVLL